MKITKKYSHFAGEEYLIVHHKQLYDEVIALIDTIDYSSSKSTKVEEIFGSKNWNKKNYTRKEFIKDQIVLAIHLEGNFNNSFDVISSHLLSYYYDEIKLGIEIFPTKQMKTQMTPDNVSFEEQVQIISIKGRSNLPVPLLILGIEP